MSFILYEADLIECGLCISKGDVQFCNYVGSSYELLCLMFEIILESGSDMKHNWNYIANTLILMFC